MFQQLHNILSGMMTLLRQRQDQPPHPWKVTPSTTAYGFPKDLVGSDDDTPMSLEGIISTLQSLGEELVRHLLQHMEREEQEFLPALVQFIEQHPSIHVSELMGRIMGQRSSDTMYQIVQLAWHTLGTAEREEMIQDLQQVMSGTYFDQWLVMNGWNNRQQRRCNSNTSHISSIDAARESEVIIQSIRKDDTTAFSKSNVPDAEDRNSRLNLEAAHDCKKHKSIEQMYPPDSIDDDDDCSFLNVKVKGRKEDETVIERETKARRRSSSAWHMDEPQNKQHDDHHHHHHDFSSKSTMNNSTITPAELQRMIQVIHMNPALSSQRKQAMIREVVDSVKRYASITNITS